MLPVSLGYLAKRRTSLKPSVATMTPPTTGASVGTRLPIMPVVAVAIVVPMEVIAVVISAISVNPLPNYLARRFTSLYPNVARMIPPTTGPMMGTSDTIMS